jgi:hypothetical protein
MNVTNILKNLKLNNILRKKNDVDIHGSCVSRDILNYDYNNDLILGKYLARSSFVSTVAEPFPEEIDLNINSPWQKRTVEIDLKKELFKQLYEDKANYLLIDFIDERLALMKYKNSIITISDELKNSNFKDFFKGENINKFNLEKSIWKRSMKEYLEKLLKIYKEEKIIIHETYFVDSYITKNGKIKSFNENQIAYNKKINALLEEYYNHIKTKLPDANVINIIENYNLAYEDHIWGNQPVHYVDSYNKQAFRILKSIILDK